MRENYKKEIQMANYTKKFTKPYANGYKDRPDTSTPVTAEIKNMETDALLAIEEYLAQNDITSFSIDGMLNEGYSIAIVEIDGEPYNLNIPELAYTSAITGGTKIGNIKLGEKSYDLYAPTGGSGGGSTVTAEATLTEGTEIGKVTIDGKEIILYAPTASAITVDAELSADSENAIQNKVVDAAVKNLQQQIDAGGTGGSITVDSTLSTESENPVQNKVVTAELDKKLEVLGDDAQAPDAVKFVLDSELSLTSENGVKNKTIAQEFENYATGVKMVAKAEEAETAQTAGSATTAETATKAAQDGNGNVIADTYAKKTEIPSGSAVDSELSGTSINPVQNKVVTAELNNIKEELGANTSKDNLWLDAYTKNKYTYDYPGYSDLGVFANSTYYPNTQISSKELRHYIGLGKYRLSFYAKVYSELETTVNSPLDITFLYKDNSKLEKTITITNNEQYFEIDFDFDKSVTEIRLYVKAGNCLIKNVTLLCMNNVEEKIDKLRKALCDLGK